MKNDLLLDFSVDRLQRKINVTREFAAPLEKVWAAWTQKVLLEKWWAPKPYQVKTKTMEFREGGFWLYAMLGPDDFEQWSRSDYQTIRELQSFSSVDTFCDAQGKASPDFASESWTRTFRENGEKTTVDVVLEFKDLEDLQKILATGFKEGFTAGMENLDVLLAT